MAIVVAGATTAKETAAAETAAEDTAAAVPTVAEAATDVMAAASAECNWCKRE